MSFLLDNKEYERWMKEARRTLDSARRDKNEGDYNWACFKAQQSAEYAIKAFLWGIGEPKYGHSLIRLISYLESIPDDIREACARLDKFYTAPRYADVWSEGSPSDYYTKSEAEEAISLAEKIVCFIERKWKYLKEGRRKEVDE